MRGLGIRVFVVSITTLALCGFASSVSASPITYVLSGNASGTIGGTPFSNALVTVLLSGDTANVSTETLGGFLPSGKVNVGTATIGIAGIGTATITGCTATVTCTGMVAIYSTGTAISPEPGFPVLPYLLIGTLDAPPATDGFTGLAAIGSNALLGYDLLTLMPPTSGSPGGVFYPTGHSLFTTLGTLSFTSNFSPTMGPATFGAVTPVVPEPSSLFLLGTGVLMCARLVVRCGRN